MLVYRIVHKRYSNSLYASGLAGRWNSKGNKVVYCAESISLAFLENMIRRKGVGFNHDFKIMFIEVPSNTKIAIINVEDLEKDWRDSDNYSKCQVVGDKWYNENISLSIKVPSAVLPEAFNYVINTAHKDYKKVKLLEVTDLIPDERIEEILKKYSKK
jgi:RES domain-containing protein